MNENKIMVSICMITYNHEAYISEAIEGVLKQQTSFIIELIIGEDCSTDNTRSICLEYQKKYPEIIKLLLPEKNLGLMLNFTETLKVSSGKYIAICEGDDYWIDPLKLQKQVDFLEKNMDYGMCYSLAKTYYQYNNSYGKDCGSKFTSFEEILLINPIVTLTTVFRKELYDNYYQTVKPVEKKWIIGDYPLWLWISAKSKIHFINEITAVYRFLEESASHKKEYEAQENYDKTILDIRLFYSELFNLKKEYVAAYFDEYHVRCIANAFNSNCRGECIIHLRSISTRTIKEKIKLFMCYSKLGFHIIRKYALTGRFFFIRWKKVY